MSWYKDYGAQWKDIIAVVANAYTVGKNHAKMFTYSEDMIGRVNNVIAQNEGNVIVYIRNLMKNNLLNRLAPVKCFAGMKEAELVEGLSIVSDNVIDKYKPDAFSVNELEELLKRESVDEIELVGVDGGGCVAFTALGACEAGLKVRMNTAAIGTIFEKRREKLYAKLKEKGAEFV